MFGKSKLQKILSLMASLTDEELATLLKKTDEMKEETNEAISENQIKENVEEENEKKSERNDDTAKNELLNDENEEIKEKAEDDKIGEAFTAIEALKDTLEALAARMDAYDSNAALYKNDFEFGLAGRTDAKANTQNALDKIKEKYWNI